MTYSINPKEPLTKKARGAIYRFVSYRLDASNSLLISAIDLTLQAERMKRDSLYDYLDVHGFKWSLRRSAWIPKPTVNKASKAKDKGK